MKISSENSLLCAASTREATIGVHLGVEYFLLNAAGSAFTGSTQASWILIDR